jgi:hypothetical protein
MFILNRFTNVRARARPLAATPNLIAGHPIGTALARLSRILSTKMLTHATGGTPHRLPTRIVTHMPHMTMHNTRLPAIIPPYRRLSKRSQVRPCNTFPTHAM